MKNDTIIKDAKWLGLFVYLHTIGEYSIVEYKGKVFKDCTPVVPTRYEEESSFLPYIGTKAISRSYDSLDHALAGDTVLQTA